jgi:DNA-binding YbaB/EbfC family protein
MHDNDTNQKGVPFMANMQQMMRQARKMQEELKKAQAEVSQMTYEATAGGGMVKATASGDMVITKLTIDPEAVDPEDVEMLQDMVTAAVNEALRGVNELSDQRMSAVTGGMNIPGMPNIPGLF